MSLIGYQIPILSGIYYITMVSLIFYQIHGMIAKQNSRNKWNFNETYQHIF